MKLSGGEKQRVSVMLLGDSARVEYAPTVVCRLSESKVKQIKKSNQINYNGISEKTYESLSSEAAQYNIDVYVNGRGWFTEEVVMKRLKRHFAFNTSEKEVATSG